MKKTISIGIPAYNEEANIGHLLHALLRQKGDNFILKEIIVVSDASTDKTDKLVRECSDNRVNLIRNNKRMGQAISQNKIIELFTGDILLLLNADVLPADEHYIQKIVHPFHDNLKLGITSSREIPLNPQGFFEKVIYYGFTVKTKIFESKNGMKNMYLCRGSNRAFSREFAKQIIWPATAAEDVYSYFKCIEMGFAFEYVDTTGVLFKLPDNFYDHLKQSARHVASKKLIKDYFSADKVNQEYKIPLGSVLKNVLSELLKHPILITSYMFIFIVTRMYPNKERFNSGKWDISESSKTLIKKGCAVGDNSATPAFVKNSLSSITVGIPTRYGGVSIIPTIESIRASVDVTINKILIIADRIPISMEVKNRLNELDVEVVWNNEEGSWGKKIIQMLALCTTDIFITTQDDVIFESTTIAEIMKAFKEGMHITMVSTAISTLPPKTFIESILDSAVRIPARIASTWNGGDNYLSASGRCLSFRTEFMRKFRIPEQIINADAFLYFENKDCGGVMRHATKSVAYIDQPQTIREQLNPSSRYQMSELELLPYYKYDISGEYHIPIVIGMQAVLSEFIQRPIQTTLYMFIFAYTRINQYSKSKASNIFWERGNSKK